MAWTAKTAFNFGFLARCAEEGLDEPHTRDRVKLAHFVCDQGKQAGDTMLGSIGNFATSLPGTILMAGGGLGAGAGYMLGSMGDNPRDPSELKMEELARVYRQHADRARRETARRRRRKSHKPPRASRLVI